MALIHSEQNDRLFEAVLALSSVEECYRFFEDICTVKEIQSIAQRMAVARLLDQGQSYQRAIAATGASSATISRVKRCLDYGAGGYRLVLDRLYGEEAAE